VTVICSTFSMPALSDTFQPFVRTGVEHDDNLFRREEGQSPGNGGDSDTARLLGGGTRFEMPVSRQLFSGIAEVVSVKFDRNRQLDHTRKNLRGDWHWFVARNFEGHVGGRYVQELPSFADFDSDQQNLRTNKLRYADGSWRFHSSWRLHAGYVKDEYTYNLPSQRASARTEDAVLSGADYLARSGSTFGLQMRRLKGTYPFRSSFGDADLFANGYVQDEVKINVLWLATGRTQVLFLGGWVQRKQRSDAERAKSGTNARLIVNWAPTGHIKLLGQAWREFSAIDGALVDSALNQGGSAAVTWDFSEKIQGIVDLKHEQRIFSPFGGSSMPVASTSPSDSSKTQSVGLIYKPLRSVTLKATAFRAERVGSATAGTRSSKANGATFSAILEFN